MDNRGIIVVKVGTSTLSDSAGRLDASYIENLTGQVCQLLKLGYKVILISSGAIGAGMEVLGLSQRPKNINELQACSAIGQGRLMKLYEENFYKRGTHTAQILITRDDLGNRERCIKAHRTIMTIIYKFNAVPVINENDTVATEEIKYTDNDTIAHIVASLVGAHTLIILTDVDGVYSSGSNKVIPFFTAIATDDIKKMINSSKNRLGSGGMLNKAIVAANLAKLMGITCIIANGRRENILLDIEKRQYVGTAFLPSSRARAQQKKSWLAFAPKSKGSIKVDDGAKAALIKANKSLLAAGIKTISGDFDAGDVVSIANLAGEEFAKGVVNFSSKELSIIKGLKTAQIEQALRRKISRDEVVHRDNLVII